MAVYVDKARIRFRNMNMSHMIADSIQELDSMAKQIGLNTKWRQRGVNSLPHYDVSDTKRAQAINAGAIPITRHELVQRIRVARQKKFNIKTDPFKVCNAIIVK